MRAQQTSGCGNYKPATPELETYSASFPSFAWKREWLKRQMAPKQPPWVGMTVLQDKWNKGKESQLEFSWRGEKNCLRYKYELLVGKN